MRRKGHSVPFRGSTLPFYFLHIVCISVEEVGHRVFDGFMLESRSCSKDSHIGDSGTQLSHSLTLEMAYNRQSHLRATILDEVLHNRVKDLVQMHTE